MKTAKIFQSKSKVTVAFMLAAIIAVGFITLSTSTNSDERLLTQQNVSTSFFDQMEDATKAYNLLKEISVEKARLEKEKAELKDEMIKAKQWRDKDQGMVVGVTFQVPQGLPEITTVRSKINSIDLKIAALKESGKALATKYGIDIQKVADDQELLSCK